MKVVILAGGKGVRLGEETRFRPKPMVEIGEKPILWHIMSHYSAYGYNDFIVCCGYKGHMIKEYFTKYFMKYSDVTFDLASGSIEYNHEKVEPWKITMVNTGLNTLTAGRIQKIEDYIGDDEEFMLTYGDGVSDVNIDKLIENHHKSGKIVTMTITKPEGRFGAIKLNDDTNEVEGFKEKAREDQFYVNAGYMVCNRQMFRYLGNGDEMLENEPMERIVAERELNAYKHSGFWAPMDSLRDKNYLESLWKSGNAKWGKRKL